MSYSAFSSILSITYGLEGEGLSAGAGLSFIGDFLFGDREGLLSEAESEAETTPVASGPDLSFFGRFLEPGGRPFLPGTWVDLAFDEAAGTGLLV